MNERRMALNRSAITQQVQMDQLALDAVLCRKLPRRRRQIPGSGWHRTHSELTVEHPPDSPESRLEKLEPPFSATTR